MDFLLNRISNMEKSLDQIESFVNEVEELDSSNTEEIKDISARYSIDKEIYFIKSTLNMIKYRIQNDKIVEKSDYTKLKQMKKQYEDLASYLKSTREL